ncbi:MAG TPA: hypothetical protein VNN72_18560 [Polyangiaceae bacterium]|nr:hypothetical protein [Polyangiaceae bacterium]
MFVVVARSCRVFASVLLLEACGSKGPTYPTYEAPALPPEQLGFVTVDERAQLVSIDRQEPSNGSPGVEIGVVPGCHALVASYEVSYIAINDKSRRERTGESIMAGGAIARQRNDYATTRPVEFFVLAKAGNKYWVTATFTGDEFLPRVVELNPAGDSTATFLPGAQCSR